MNTPLHAIEKGTVKPAAVREISLSRQLYWSLRRELWETRSIYLAPLIVTGLFLLGFMVNLAHLPKTMSEASALEPMLQHQTIQRPYLMASLLLMFVTFVIGLFYSLEAFQGERRDRSILFWKSLPVSDTTTVLTKAAIPILVLPLVTCVAGFALQFVMLLLSTARLAGTGHVSLLWSHASPLQMWPALLFHMVGMHGLWYAPFYGWFMVVSSWAKRAALLWATLPLLAIGFAEKVAFNTNYFGRMLAHRFAGNSIEMAQSGDSGLHSTAGGMSMESMTPFTFSEYLVHPGLWIGLAITAAFLFVAIRMRRYRGPVGA